MKLTQCVLFHLLLMNMYTAHRLKKIKPPDPGQQHNIRKFIADCTKVGLLPSKTKGLQPKKRRRSTGEKIKNLDVNRALQS